jgi:hypothetical protein
MRGTGERDFVIAARASDAAIEHRVGRLSACRVIGAGADGRSVAWDRDGFC